MSAENKKIVVVGGSSGMGLATARHLARDGIQVVIASRSQAKLNAIEGPAEAKPLDFTSEEGVRDFFEEVGRFDHLLLMGAGRLH